MFCEKAFSCSVYMFGSSSNGLGFSDCDMDMHVRIWDTNRRPILVTVQEARTFFLRKIAAIFRQSVNKLYYPIYIDARCPIVKLHPKNPILKLLECDINVTNSKGIYNSIFIKTLCTLCPTFRHLAVLLKQWHKVTTANSRNMNSYTFTLLVIFFLQNCSPQPLLKPIRLMPIDFNQYSNYCPPDEFERMIYPYCQVLVNQITTPISTFDLIEQFFK